MYYETQYSIDGKKWMRFMDRHITREAAVESARSRCNEEIATRVARVTVEPLDLFEKIPGKKRRPLILPGVGAID